MRNTHVGGNGSTGARWCGGGMPGTTPIGATMGVPSGPVKCIGIKAPCGGP